MTESADNRAVVIECSNRGRVVSRTRQGSARRTFVVAALVAVIAAAIVGSCAVAASSAAPSRRVGDRAMTRLLQYQIEQAEVELALSRSELAGVRHANISGQGREEITADGEATRTITAVVTDNSGTVSGVLVRFTVTGANAGATGTCFPVDCRSDGKGEVLFTYFAPNPGDDSVIIVCEPETPTVTLVTQPPPSPPNTNPPGKPDIFQVELRNCRNVHVGYNYFPEGTVVAWTVTHEGRVVGTGQFTAEGGGSRYHFLTQPFGGRIPPYPDGEANFTWQIDGRKYSYSAARAPGC